MTDVDPPSPPQPPASAPGGVPPSSLHLQYATPPPPKPWRPGGPDDPLLRVIRQIVFAVGLALLAFGLTCAWAEVYTRDAPYYAAWGAGFLGLATPLWRVRKE